MVPRKDAGDREGAFAFACSLLLFRVFDAKLPRWSWSDSTRMKHYSPVLVCLLVYGLLWAPAHAAPFAIECRNAAQLTAPSSGSTVAGAVEIRGRAVVADFKFYKVEYARLGQDQWTLIGPDVITRPVQEGGLVVWQSSSVPDGAYRLRLHVVDSTGNYCEAHLAPILVANRGAPTETPAPTDTPVLTAVPPGPTATPRGVVVPTVIAPPTQSALNPRGGPAAFLPDLNVMVYGIFFLCGAGLMLVFIALIAMFVFLRQYVRE